MARRNKTSTAKKPPRAAVERLPDELLQRIFEPALLAHGRQTQSEPSRKQHPSYLPANEYLTLSKRFYALLRPVRLRRATFDLNKEKSTLALAKDAIADELCQHLRILSIVVGLGFSPLYAVALAQLRSVQSVTIQFHSDLQRTKPGRVEMPEMLIDALTKMEHLRELAFSEPIIVTTPPAHRFTALRSLRTHFVSLDAAAHALWDGVKILSIDVGGTFHHVHRQKVIGLMPWAALELVKITPSPGNHECDLSEALRLCLQQTTLLTNTARLSTLRVSAAIVVPVETMRYAIELAESLHCPRLVCSLSQELVVPLFGISTCLRELVFHAVLPLHNVYYLNESYKLIDSLKGARFLQVDVAMSRKHSAPSGDKLAEVDEHRMALTYPVFFAFLYALAQTSLTAIFARAVGDDVRACWSRQTTAAAFQRDPTRDQKIV